jgi:hypothetical protein
MELLFMKARIAFYFAAVVALVLFLAAAVPSHATQHRDPALTLENMQKAAPAPPSAKPTAPSAASESDTPKAHHTTGRAKKESGGSQGATAKAGRAKAGR